MHSAHFSDGALVDYEKALRSVATASALEVLKDHQGILETCMRLLKDIYKAYTGRIVFHKKEKFPIRKSDTPSL